ncbi:hypothetical protein PHLCEN_2v1829 [Hermanssonia centrifuga]|uniref:BRCT domain-containing protein n=1 Tax=Hermanssonia centrifuga TaxID=98765 RepID=A0A2R6RVS1_9APHY|nr:hypothetical protein PHLCEN_2v1829 [Hermanssonia centrifuga]
MSIESPSSSVSTNAYIFHDGEGNQLRIFTESTIQGRPKLVASLKKAGAINAHIKNAQIILVDSSAEPAKSLAAVWRDKVVLDVCWAYQAIGRGAYQGEDEDWGGHCVRGDSVDDGVLPTHASANQTPPVDVMNDSSAQLQESVPPSLSQGHASSPYPSSPIFQPTSPAMSDTVHPHQDHRDETVSARNSVPGPSVTPRMKEKRRETFMEPVAKRPRLSTGVGLQPIFRTESGEPLAFFVSMDLNNRNDIVNLIKKNGGKIYADIPHADIVVLAPRKGPFADHLMAAVIAQKPAVQATFVHQCVLERTLLDPGDFSFEGVEAKNRKNQVFTVRLDDLEDRASPLRKSKDERRKKRSGESTGSPTRASPSKRERSLSAEPLVEVEVQHTVVASGGDPCRSPSPIPPTRIVEIGGGRNAYTDEDKEYFEKYVTHLLRRDPQISTSTIARELGKKVWP